jgi:hypothetical protein
MLRQNVALSTYSMSYPLSTAHPTSGGCGGSVAEAKLRSGGSFTVNQTVGESWSITETTFVVVPLSLLVADLTARLIESPAIRLGKKLAGFLTLIATRFRSSTNPARDKPDFRLSNCAGANTEIVHPDERTPVMLRKMVYGKSGIGIPVGSCLLSMICPMKTSGLLRDGHISERLMFGARHIIHKLSDQLIVAVDNCWL